MADEKRLENSYNVTTSKPFGDKSDASFMWIAPPGTTLPTDPVQKLDPAFKATGFITEDGLTEPQAQEQGDAFNDAGGRKMIDADSTFNKTWTGTFAEAANIDVLKALFGSDMVTVDEAAGILTYEEDAISPESHVIVVDEFWRKTPEYPNGRRVRHVMPNATIMITGDITHNSTSLVSYPFTVSASASGDKRPQITYMQIPKTASQQSNETKKASSSK